MALRGSKSLAHAELLVSVVEGGADYTIILCRFGCGGQIKSELIHVISDGDKKANPSQKYFCHISLIIVAPITCGAPDFLTVSYQLITQYID